MTTKKESLLLHIGANVVIVIVIAFVLLASLGGTGAVHTLGKGRAIYQGNPAEPRVTLMVNVYWGTEYIEDMLKVFERYGVKTTFFVGGSWAAKNNALVKKIHEMGHEIGNHGYMHKDHKKLNYSQNRDEIIVTDKLVEGLIGVKMRLFAPPSGSMGEAMFDVCRDYNYSVIMWSKDTIDWRDKDESLVYKRAVKDIRNGDLVLMHPTAHTLAALPAILSYYKTNGMRCTTVSENLLGSDA
ncbi:MAG: polysaccharide deacetylase family protein [Clostridia bacterium]